jgi:DNA-binding transcriptional LysR family regulator
MNLRHIQAFIAAAEELHFGRAAKRLHVEQSPLSRTIRQLEADLGAVLLKRTARGLQLTGAGRVFLADARRIALTSEQARAGVRAAAAGYRGLLRIALTDGIGLSRLSALLALCREEAPDVRLRLFETSPSRLMSGLGGDLFDAGLTLAGEASDGIAAAPVWRDPLRVVVPARHPLLAFKAVPLEEALAYPLILCRSEEHEDYCPQIGRLLRSTDAQPDVAEYVTTHALMLALVAAGYGVGFASAAFLAGCRQADVVFRPLAGDACLTTYLLMPAGETAGPLVQFAERARRVGHSRTGARLFRSGV